jgi:hypothetical protein
LLDDAEVVAGLQLDDFDSRELEKTFSTKTFETCD